MSNVEIKEGQEDNNLCESCLDCNSCESMDLSLKVPIYKRVWFWVLFVAIIGLIVMFIPFNKTENIGVEDNNVVSENTTIPNDMVYGSTTVIPESALNASVPDEYKDALHQAKSYSDAMFMSKKAIQFQLQKGNGGKYSAEAAQYAVDNLDANWSRNALESAKLCKVNEGMTDSEIREYLLSDEGGKFTLEEVEYAMANL